MNGFSKIKLAFRFPPAAAERIRARLWAGFKIAHRVKKGIVLAPPPITVSINLTYLCNLKCRMCGQWRRNDCEVLPLEKLKKLVDEMAPFKPKFYLWGGEPLLYPEIGPLLDYLKDKKQYVIINTNGVLLRQFAETIVNCGVDGLDISLDGPREIHDEIRGVPGTFDRVMDGVSRVRELQRDLGSKNPMLKVICTISEWNQLWLEETLSFFNTRRYFDALVVNLGWFTTEKIGRANDRIFRKYLGCESVSWKEFVDALGEVDPKKIESFMKSVNSRRKKRSIPVFFIPPINPQEVEAYYSRPALPIGKKMCFNPWLNPEIKPNGDVTFCPDFPDYIIGNLKEKPLMEIWNGERARKFRGVLLERGLFPICSRCCGLYAY
ncbi:MAG: radical SAM protein [Candidatus Euphemobacter frigidus]|nr:radical SAM protein [Candidatus Euphemobacter frigidus]MDP8275124.1 radical SAM protein [Candidatus Euphemobacter frigidus]